ncbi:MAG: nuclear transport factor 2 family protein [Spirochaetaceae bacterium]|nr:nuclear transport factor 2 family protein [Myxococcales bacterium]MCB9723057.1 nuclear transport factor 2 family protein [Spirochaetaceae bacterium]HPG25045.1 nuclear transport factor 2 family protein [Myxococcota bacterium]
MGLLEEIEAIRQLKYRYLRAVDLKDFALLESTFAPDAVSAYDGGRQILEGRDAIVGWLRNAIEHPFVTLHQAHHPEIELTSATTARGTWYLEDRVINPGPARPEMPARSILSGAAFYADEYEKRDGAWVITRTGYERTYFEIRPFEPPGTWYSRWEA